MKKHPLSNEVVLLLNNRRTGCFFRRYLKSLKHFTWADLNAFLEWHMWVFFRFESSVFAPLLLSHNLIIIKGDYNPDPTDVQTSYKTVSAALSLPAAILALKTWSFFTVTLKWRDFVYPCLCLFNISHSGGSFQIACFQDSPCRQRANTPQFHQTEQCSTFPPQRRAAKYAKAVHHGSGWLKIIVKIF